MSKRTLFFVLTCILFLTLTAAAKFAIAGEKVYHDAYVLAGREDVDFLKSFGVSIESVDVIGVRVYATDEQLQELGRAGYEYFALPQEKRPGFYPTLTQALNTIQSYQTTYPDIMRVSQIGSSAGGHPIYAVRITDNPDTEEVEPELIVDCNIHGNEGIGFLTCDNFIKYLGNNYGSDTTVTNIVNNHELWFIPLLNPDGYNADIRYNSNGYDLNRCFGFWWDGYEESQPAGPSPLSQPETQAATWLAINNNPILAISFHSGAALINYPFNTREQRAPDNDNLIFLANSYMSASGYITQMTNGWDWYAAFGISEEQYYGSAGSLPYTVELSNTYEPTTQSDVDYYTSHNVPAIMDWIGKSDFGVHGVIKNQADEPVEAMVIVQELDWPAYSDPLLGDYHRFLLPGSYNLWVWANGYQPQVVPVTVTKESKAAQQDITLEPSGEGKTYAFRVIVAFQPMPYSQSSGLSYPHWALGPADGKSVSLGKRAGAPPKGGYFILDMGENTPIKDEAGNDFRVVEGDSTPEGYSVYVSQDWLGPWSLVGNGTGTTEFDISATGLSEARYVKILDDGDGTPGATAGMELDAVETIVNCSAPVADFYGEPTTGPAPLTVQFYNTTQADAGCLSGSQWDFGDTQISEESAPSHVYTEPGTYTVTLTATGPGGNDTETKEDYIVVTPPGSDDDSGDDDDSGGGNGGGAGCGC